MSIPPSISNLSRDGIGTINCNIECYKRERLLPTKESWRPLYRHKLNSALKNGYDLGIWKFIQKLFHQCLPYASTILDAGECKNKM